MKRPYKPILGTVIDLCSCGVCESDFAATPEFLTIDSGVGLTADWPDGVRLCRRQKGAAGADNEAAGYWKPIRHQVEWKCPTGVTLITCPDEGGDVGIRDADDGDRASVCLPDGYAICVWQPRLDGVSQGSLATQRNAA